jgi:glycogen debranching enzyme
MSGFVARQPALNDLVTAISAPTQAWLSRDGEMRAGAEGLYHGDVRVLSGFVVTVDGEAPLTLAVDTRAASRAVFTGVARAIDTGDADPKVRIDRAVEIGCGRAVLMITLDNGNDVAVAGQLRVALECDMASMDAVKNGHPTQPAAPSIMEAPTGYGIQWATDDAQVRLFATDSETLDASSNTVELGWSIELDAHAARTIRLTVEVDDARSVVGPGVADLWGKPEFAHTDARLDRLIERSLNDLASLVMTSRFSPQDCFLAAGAPWYFTLFGRDSLWAARMMLPLGTKLAEGTLRTLAALQGSVTVVSTAEQPGKIPHEVRRTTFRLDEGPRLPPIYYGTTDATPLWIVLLHDAWAAGMTSDIVAELAPNLRAALSWIRDHADPDGDGFLEYIDESGHGLANQGWKDSSDSIQFKTGELANGPIALVEVQAYAFEAAVKGAILLDALGADEEAQEWRLWAERMKQRFRESFWLEDDLGPYLGLALDRDKNLVDAVASNMGHVLGTGILSPEESAIVAERLVHPTMSSGYGLRTLASDSAGYWPWKYHGGSVWPHDTAIAIRGMAIDGHASEAAHLASGILAAAESFHFRLPELYSGEERKAGSAAIPYPASCHPQAWSAAAAISIADSLSQPGTQ